MIPSGWLELSLGEAAPLRYGRALPATVREAGSVPVYSSAGRTGTHNESFVDGPTVIVGRKGNVGAVYFEEHSSYPIDTTFFTSGSPSAEPRFLYYKLQTLGLQDLSRDSAVPGLQRAEYERLRTTFPGRPEQQAIAEVLGALDDKIAANIALAATAEQVLRAEIDAEWLRREDRSSTLSDFVELNPKVPVPRTESAIYVDMKRLPESGWSIDGFDYREPKGGARFQNGDTLLARITPCLENRKTGFVDHLEDGQVGVGSTEFIVLRARNDVASPISFLLATAPRFRDHAIQHMIGTSGRQRVAASDLASFEMPKPDSGWMADFGARAVALFQAVAALSAENRTLAATRDALLPQLMSGKLRVREGEAAVSEAGV